MKTKLSFLLLSIAFTLSSCSNNDCISSGGKITTEQRSVEDFTKIELEGAFKVTIRQDSFSLMKITADENVIPKVKSRVSGNTLHIQLEDKLCDSGEVEIALSAKVWESIESSGASEITGSNSINTDNLDIDLSGASKINLNLVVSRLKTEASGSSKIALTGQARQHIMNLSGSNTTEAFGFVVSDYRIETSGASKLNINVLNNLEVKSSGVSDISYKGTPKNISNSKNGSANLNKVAD
jgi:hypothetical protein